MGVYPIALTARLFILDHQRDRGVLRGQVFADIPQNVVKDPLLIRSDMEVRRVQDWIVVVYSPWLAQNPAKIASGS